MLEKFFDNKNASEDDDDAIIPDWLSNLANNSDETDSESFTQQLKEDFFTHRIFVFTPLGTVIDLPEGSTPIDFAFMVHTEIGQHTAGAKIGGKLVSLDTELKNGDIVEIITKPNATANKKWLGFVQTNEARKKIKSYLARDNS